MDCHLNSVLLAYGTDCLEEVDEVLKELLGCDVLVSLEEVVDLCESFRLPARHDEAV